MYYKKWIGYICRDENNSRGNVSKSQTDPKWVKWIHRELSDRHCQECLKLDGCWFLKSKTPEWPHHVFCHCLLEDLPYSRVLAEATANAAYRKFDPYLFNTDGIRTHGKEILLNQWGYTVEDATWLQQEFIRQGLEKYIKGEYELGLLNDYGQRISIVIEIPRRDKPQQAEFTSGWMVYPDGRIQLNTPYGGK